MEYLAASAAIGTRTTGRNLFDETEFAVELPSPCLKRRRKLGHALITSGGHGYCIDA